MKKLSMWVLVGCWLTSTIWVYAGDGSVYSKYGIGDIVDYSGSRISAMGGNGIALITDGYVNASNPAALSALTRTEYSADFQYQGYSMNDGTGTNFLSSGNIQAAMLAFPVYSPYKLVFGFGLTPFSQIGYDISENETEAGQNITQIFDGNGGLSSFQISAAFSPLQDVSLGATMQYIFGQVDYRQRLEYGGTDFYTTDEDRLVSLQGFGATIGGALAGIDKAFGLSNDKHLTIAATFFTGAKMDAKEQLLENFITSRETTQVAYGSATLPIGFALGLMYQPSDKVIVTGDAKFQRWADYTYFGVHPPEIQNSSRFGIGAEFSPRSAAGESYFRQVSYRVGTYTQTSYLELNDVQIKEYFVAGGIGIPIFFSPGSEARLNLGLEYGIRGTTSNGLERDNIMRMTISISGSDTWFNPSEIE